MKITQSRKHGFRYVLLLLGVIILLSSNGVNVSLKNVGIGVVALALGYFTGLIALSVGLLFSVYAFLIGLPVISAVYAYTAYLLARIHYMLATYVFKKVLKRTRWYNENRAKIKNSGGYKSLSKLFDKITLKTGIAEPQMLRLFEVEPCHSCRKKIPKDGVFCPYCGLKTDH